MGIECGLLLILLLSSTPLMVYGVEHAVGDSSGWNTNVNYVSWASSKTFTVGDTLGKFFFSSSTFFFFFF